MSSFPLALQQRFLTAGPFAQFSSQHLGEFVMPGVFPLGKLADPSYQIFDWMPEVSGRDPNISGETVVDVEPATAAVLNSLQTDNGRLTDKESKRRRYIEELSKGRGATSLGSEVPEQRSVEDSESINQIARIANL